MITISSSTNPTIAYGISLPSSRPVRPRRGRAFGRNGSDPLQPLHGAPGAEGQQLQALLRIQPPPGVHALDLDEDHLERAEDARPAAGAADDRLPAAADARVKVETIEKVAEFRRGRKPYSVWKQKMLNRDELQSHIGRLEQSLHAADDDAQLANVELENALQKQQQLLQQMSNISKMLHERAAAIIRQQN